MVGLKSCCQSSVCPHQRFKRAIFVHFFIPLFSALCPAVTSFMKIITSFLSILKTRCHNFYLISKVCTYFFLNLYGWSFFKIFLRFLKRSLILIVFNLVTDGADYLIQTDVRTVCHEDWEYYVILFCRNDLSMFTESQVPNKKQTLIKYDSLKII